MTFNQDDEEDIYFEDDEQDDQTPIEAEEYCGDAAEEDILDTPEKKYKSAKDNIGFDDYYAIDTFYEIYCDENAREKLRRKSLKKAAITLSQHEDDLERILGALTDVFQAYNDKMFDTEDLIEVVTGMLSHLMKSSTALQKFLDAASKKVNKSTNQLFFVDLKLRQCELMMSNQDYEKVKECMNEMEQLISFTPEETDILMRNSCVRFLTIKIELADTFDNEKEMIEQYERVKKFNNVPLSTNQTAILTKIEGIVLLKERKFKLAKDKLFRAFELFDEAGNYKRVHCIPYCALAEMLSHDLMSLFMNPKVIPFKQHEKVIAFDQLSRAYMDFDILKYNDLMEPAAKHFTDQFYLDLIKEVGLFVLRGAAKNICRAYQGVTFEYMATIFGCKKEEVQKQVLDLILSGEIRALIDPEREAIVIMDTVRQSQYLINTNSMIDSMEMSVQRLSNSIQIDY